MDCTKKKNWNDFLRCVSQKIFLTFQVRTLTHVSVPQTAPHPLYTLSSYLTPMHFLFQAKNILFNYMPIYFYLFY